MIKRIDIANFGSFKNFSWNSSVKEGGSVRDFKRVNILYGRNFSGKTTLSRIVRSLQTGTLPDKYENPSFIVTTGGGSVNESQIPDLVHNIRVYNKDFVDENLGFLKDSNGEIIPFAIIGSENNALEKEIAEKEKRLGSVEEKSGLRYTHSLKHAAFTDKESLRSGAESNLQNKLRNKATDTQGGIKHNAFYSVANYNTPKITADIQKILREKFLPYDEVGRLERVTLLSETALPDIAQRIVFESALAALTETAKELLERKITPTAPIQEMLNDSILQAWVQSGIPLHKEKRENCGFCGGVLPATLWKQLDEHFSKESQDLGKELDDLIAEIDRRKEAVADLITIDIAGFYSSYHPAFEDNKKKIEKEVKAYRHNLGTIAAALEARKKDIFTVKTLEEVGDNSVAVNEAVSAMNLLIENNNKKTKSLADDQTKARLDLRLSEVSRFIQDIDFEGETKKIEGLTIDAAALKEELVNLYDEIKAIEQTVEGLKIQLKDEKKGAEKVNEYLHHYFGHQGLRLEAVEKIETSSFKFQIFRGDSPAYNLSEGECSLVAFCYFVAQLEDANSKGKKLLIYIDDPISSLDSNHIFFLYSLIEAFIAQPEQSSNGEKQFRYEQLFISTHNLDFLKYLKRLSHPKNDCEEFLVIGKESGSTLELMPGYLKNYVTEFSYLFGEICICVNPGNASTHPHCFYNFGNNLRKFLEAFLYFKYPFSANNGDHNKRIDRFFKDNPPDAPFVHRLTNEFSHLGGIIDRAAQPVDYAEISKLAAFVLKKIKDKDVAQFECLMESIGKQSPLETQ